MKKLMAMFMAALVAPVLVATAQAPRPAAPAGEVPEISIAEVKAAIAAKTVTLLDANGTDSWKDGHIPGAIDFAAHQNQLASVLPADKSALVVAYCGGPRCHAYAAAARAAKELGYTNVRHLAAGIHGWMNANEATEKGG